MQGPSPTVSSLMAAAFLTASATHRTRHEDWIAASHKVGGLLPGSLLVTSVQALGNIDLILFSMEGERTNAAELEDVVPDLIALDIQRILSEGWISAAYEIIRLLKSRKLWPVESELCKLEYELSLLRTVIDKHELASDHKLSAPIPTQRFPSLPTDVAYHYDKSDDKRAHIMLSGLSTRGSFIWQATDAVKRRSRWIDRQDVSNCLLRLFVQSASTVDSSRPQMPVALGPV